MLPCASQDAHCWDFPTFFSPAFLRSVLYLTVEVDVRGVLLVDPSKEHLVILTLCVGGAGVFVPLLDTVLCL